MIEFYPERNEFELSEGGCVFLGLPEDGSSIVWPMERAGALVDKVTERMQAFADPDLSDVGTRDHIIADIARRRKLDRLQRLRTYIVDRVILSELDFDALLSGGEL